jgi:hypothetical protein
MLVNFVMGELLNAVDSEGLLAAFGPYPKENRATLNFGGIIHMLYSFLFKEITKYMINTQSAKDNNSSYLQLQSDSKGKSSKTVMIIYRL